MKSSLVLLGASLLFLLCSLLSCVDGEYAIFYTIENEKEIADNPSLPNDVAVNDIVRAADAYYISAVSLWAKQADTQDAEWKKTENSFTPDTLDSTAQCNALAYFSVTGKLFASFYSPSEAAHGLYVADPIVDITTTSALQWAAVTDTDLAEKQIASLMQLSDNLLACIVVPGGSGTPQSYAVYVSADGTEFSGPVLESLARPVTDASYDGTTYWVVAGQQVFSGTALNASAMQVVSVESKQANEAFAGAHYSANFGGVYLSSSEGRIHHYDGTWQASEQIEVSSTVVSFTDMIELADRVLVGTRGHGYYEIAAGDIGDSANFSRMPGLTKTDLHYGVVLRLYQTTDDGAEVIFACTYGAGLWRGQYTTDGTTVSADWNRE